MKARLVRRAECCRGTGWVSSHVARARGWAAMLLPRARLLSTGRPRRLRSIDALRAFVARRKPLCVAVTDAADFEGSCPPRSLSNILQDEEVVLAINNADLLPRLEENDVRYLQRRFSYRKVSTAGNRAFAVSSTTGKGI